MGGASKSLGHIMDMVMLENKKLIQGQTGSVLIFEVVAIFIFSLVLLALLGYASSQLRVIKSTTDKELAFHIAEAGVNYYQWHLAHFPSDYADGTGQSCNPCGPYVKDYRDTDTNEVVGQYSLTITPPLIGSTIVTIQSTGWTMDNPKIKRVATVRYGIPSLAKYGFLTHSYVHVGSSSVFNGEFHSNSGIQFDGTGNAPIQSARATYTCSGGSNDDCSGSHNGIWAGSGPTGGSSTTSLWQFPVPNVDYSTITSDLATMKTSAQTGGLYLAPSSQSGYLLRFQSNGTFRVYKVTSLESDPNWQDVGSSTWNSSNIDYNGLSEQTTVCNPYPCSMPGNGVIYVEDTTWVEGTVRGRALVAAAFLPYNSSTAPSIRIQGNILYSAKDGTDVLGLIGQKDVLIGHSVPNDLEIDAALIAQNGAFKRYHFSSNLKDDLTVYGSISSFNRAAVYYGSSGFQTRNYTYDANLLYGPPPSFPLSTEGYRQISWESN